MLEDARRKLRMINIAIEFNDLKILPANRLEKPGGELRTFLSIRINGLRRIIF
ncbi:MAG: type II toxin-antitoxin system RelE/ParE family toxin [Chitinophagaceae bacterium]